MEPFILSCRFDEMDINMTREIYCHAFNEHNSCTLHIKSNQLH